MINPATNKPKSQNGSKKRRCYGDDTPSCRIGVNWQVSERCRPARCNKLCGSTRLVVNLWSELGFTVEIKEFLAFSNGFLSGKPFPILL